MNHILVSSLVCGLLVKVRSYMVMIASRQKEDMVPIQTDLI